MTVVKRAVTAGLLCALLLSSGCTGKTELDARVQPLVKPYLFSIAGWEVKTLSGQTGSWLAASFANLPFHSRAAEASFQATQGGGEVAEVSAYFADAGRIRTLQSQLDAPGGISATRSGLEAELNSLEKEQNNRAAGVEKIIKRQIRDALAEAGIFNPFASDKIGFPPVNFRLQEMPSLLVISPRDKIEPLREIVLQQDMTLEQREALEASVDKMDVSSLVLGVGGIATYPSLVDYSGGLAWTLETAAHEWAHQYLAFTPLGFRYILDETGISKNYDIATMNESLANIVGKEIGDAVYHKYYAPREPVPSQKDTAASQKWQDDFNSQMRETRKAVDAYLANGQIAEAEALMEQKRLELASQGYYIRKLNQAYFAFNGTYADGPAFVNPIGLELKQLRSKSASLKDFLNTVSRMTSRQDLAESVR